MALAVVRILKVVDAQLLFYPPFTQEGRRKLSTHGVCSSVHFFDVSHALLVQAAGRRYAGDKREARARYEPPMNELLKLCSVGRCGCSAPLACSAMYALCSVLGGGDDDDGGEGDGGGSRLALVWASVWWLRCSGMSSSSTSIRTCSWLAATNPKSKSHPRITLSRDPSSKAAPHQRQGSSLSSVTARSIGTERSIACDVDMWTSPAVGSCGACRDAHPQKRHTIHPAAAG